MKDLILIVLPYSQIQNVTKLVNPSIYVVPKFTNSGKSEAMLLFEEYMNEETAISLLNLKCSEYNQIIFDCRRFPNWRQQYQGWSIQKIKYNLIHLINYCAY